MSPLDDPAYPNPSVSQNNATGETTSWQSYGGLTKLELVSAMALQGILSRTTENPEDDPTERLIFAEKAAHLAVLCAEALFYDMREEK